MLIPAKDFKRITSITDISDIAEGVLLKKDGSVYIQDDPQVEQFKKLDIPSKVIAIAGTYSTYKDSFSCGLVTEDGYVWKDVIYECRSSFGENLENTDFLRLRNINLLNRQTDENTSKNTCINVRCARESSSVRISWSPPPGMKAKKYLVYRSAKKGSNWNAIAEVNGDTTSYLDEFFGEDEGSYEYYYKVIAKNEDGTLSKSSNEEKFYIYLLSYLYLRVGQPQYFLWQIGGIETPDKYFSDPESISDVVKKIDENDKVTPIIVNGRTLMPISFIIRYYGGRIQWIEDTRRVEIKLHGHSSELWVNKNKMVVDGQEIALDVSPQIINNRTYIPIRTFEKIANAEIEWNDNKKEIQINFKLGEYMY